MKAHALRILRAALAAADPGAAVTRYFSVNGDTLRAGRHRYRLEKFDNIYVIGAGKASAAMARPVERLLKERISSGLINVKHGDQAKLRRIDVNQCGHPIPDQNGLRGAERIANLARQAGPRDLLICLISGGASALLPLPIPPVSLQDKQRLTQLLLDCGATIHEINCVRKHLSQIKGGQLARLGYPATVVTLILSDVIGDDLDVIGSGPTVPDRSTFADAAAILDKYRLWKQAPREIAARIRRAEGETPKPGDPAFARVKNVIVGSNRLAIDAAAQQARALGYRTLILSSYIEGETREVAKVHTAIAKEIFSSGRPVRRPACILSGGETTVTIRGKGLGGRNQEFVLAAAIEIAGLKGVTILSAGTDGSDGPTDAAGAIADGDTVRRKPDAANYLSENDSYHYFEALGDLIKTGPTGTNVMDLRLLLLNL
ncbi:MAG: glycerate kinase [Acidobacteriota bacterium]|nr:glycerate kinase [Acidobacteriota bacterium]